MKECSRNLASAFVRNHLVMYFGIVYLPTHSTDGCTVLVLYVDNNRFDFAMYLFGAFDELCLAMHVPRLSWDVPAHVTVNFCLNLVQESRLSCF